MKKGSKIGIAAAVILALAGMTGCNSTSQKNDGADSQISSAGKSSETSTTDQTEFKVGDVLEAKGLKIVYVASGEYVSDQFKQPAEGKKYIRAEFYCENISESDKNFSEFDFECFAGGAPCEQVYPGGGELSATLSPGRSTSGSVYFEVPEDAADIQLEYGTDSPNDQKVFFVYEGEKDSGFVPEANSCSAGSAFAVGDVAETETMRISYLSCGEHTSDNEFVQPAEGKHFIYCEFEFENISDSDQLVSVYDFDCFADGTSCNASYAEKDELSATLSAGRKTQGKVYFEVPADAENVEIEYVDDSVKSERLVFAYQP